MTPLLVFLGSLAADYGTSFLAIRRGLAEGNPVLKVSPVLTALVSAALVIGAAEYFKGAGYAGWQPIYWIGSGLHFGLALWNLSMIARKGR